MLRDRAPLDAVITALNLENARQIECGELRCYICNFARIMDVAVYKDNNDNLFLRGLDLVSPHIWKADDDPNTEESRISGPTILQWCRRFRDLNDVKADSGTDTGRELRELYRTLIGNPRGEVWRQYSNIRGQLGRTSGRFIAVELLPYLLYHFALLDQAPRPHLEPAWELIRAMSPFFDFPFSRIGERKMTAKTLRRLEAGETLAEVMKRPAPKSERPELEEAEIVVSQAAQIVAWEKRYQERGEELKKIRARNELLQEQNSKFLSQKSVPGIQGQLAEDAVLRLLEEHAPQFSQVRLVARIPNHADILIIYRDHEDKLLGYAILDVKDWASVPVYGEEVMKLERDINSCTERYGTPPLWSAIISMRNNICHEGRTGRHYQYRGVPVLLVKNMMLRSNDGGSTEIQELFDMASLLMTRQPPVQGEINVEALLTVGTKFSRRAEPSPSEPAYAIRTVPRSQMRELLLHQEEVSLPVSSVCVLDPRLFRPASELTTKKVQQATLLSRIIRYREGVKIEISDIIKIWGPQIQLESKEARQVMGEICIGIKGFRKFPHAELIE